MPILSYVQLTDIQTKSKEALKIASRFRHFAKLARSNGSETLAEGLESSALEIESAISELDGYISELTLDR